MVLLMLVCLPRSALTEGAVKVLDCTVLRQCDAAGNCAAGEGAVSFRMEPIALDAAGSGTYSLSYAEGRAATPAVSDTGPFETRAVSDTGPFLWNQGRDRHSLLVSSEAEWLWHSLRLQAIPGSTVRFLRCEFQQ